MPDLAACYFCGTDAAASLALNEETTVSLCADCREKLETVLSAIDRDTPGEADEPVGPQPGEGSEDATIPSDPRGGEPGPPAADGDEADAPTADSGAGDQSIVAGDQDLSALEYNKVMRMLQNREFPVDRDEFVAVAANAYQVGHVDCDRVIDAAIAEGLIDEEDGKLVKTD